MAFVMLMVSKSKALDAMARQTSTRSPSAAAPGRRRTLAAAQSPTASDRDENTPRLLVQRALLGQTVFVNDIYAAVQCIAESLPRHSSLSS